MSKYATLHQSGERWVWHEVDYKNHNLRFNNLIHAMNEISRDGWEFVSEVSNEYADHGKAYVFKTQSN